MRLEDQILSQLCVNEEYSRAVLPHLKPEYFGDQVDKHLFNLINSFISKYNVLPSKESLLIEVNDSVGLNDTQNDEATKRVKSFETSIEENRDWLLERTEKFCQDKSIHNAILESIVILDNSNDKRKVKLTKEAIPSLLSDALSVSFDTSVGHDFLEDAESRFAFYNNKENKISTGLETFDKATGGGFTRKTLNMFLGGTSSGKSLCKCALAANFLKQGYNVVYITMEMAEERIAERIDANLMNLPINDVHELSLDTYIKKIDRLKTTVKGKLIIKEYPTGGASSSNFRHLLRELKQKKRFVPDIVILDYLNICSSAKMNSTDGNSYAVVKSIAEETRGLAVETNTVWISSTQTNRSGYNNSEVEMTNVSESFGLPATVDFMLAIIRSEELDTLGQIMFKQLKNRYQDLSEYRKFIVGVHRSKMKLYDVESSAQTGGIMKDIPVMDNTEFGKRVAMDRSKFKEFS